MKTATEIAVEVRAAESVEEAAFLIERFADRKAQVAAERAVKYTTRSITDTLGVLFESPVRRKEAV
jgi:hypothetical protein